MGGPCSRCEEVERRDGAKGVVVVLPRTGSRLGTQRPFVVEMMADEEVQEGRDEDGEEDE